MKIAGKDGLLFSKIIVLQFFVLLMEPFSYYTCALAGESFISGNNNRPAVM